MATLIQKIHAEAKVRELIAAQGMPEPDEVEYGFTCIRLLWHEPKVVLVVDIDPPEEGFGDTEQAVRYLEAEEPEQW
jgi:hypothetical protein